MKRMIEWVVAMLPRRRSPEAVDQPSKSIAVEDLVVPDIYVVEHVDTVPVLKVIDLSSPDIDKSTGFNPYDTAVLRKK